MKRSFYHRISLNPQKRLLRSVLRLSTYRPFRSRFRSKHYAIVIVSLVAGLTLFINFRDFGYLTRPIWDTPPAPFNISPHFDHPALPLSQLCTLHGWKSREDNSTVRIFDATIFSFENDLLEIRLRELWNVVDQFVIVEADKTFTGQPKPLRFPTLRKSDHFSWADSKILYKEVTLQSPDESNVSLAKLAWENEATMRRQLTLLLLTHGMKDGDLIIQSDVDEIPFQRTVGLFRACQGYPDLIHLEMRAYLYSFEFPRLGPGDAKTSIKTKRVDDEWYYSHQRQTDDVLADAGWHCSFCFRHLADFRMKMLGYSHFDRVTNPKFLQDAEIQDRICTGKDLFDMFPVYSFEQKTTLCLQLCIYMSGQRCLTLQEVFSFRDLVYQFWRNLPQSKSFIQIPEWVLRNSRRFAFLLPGGCIR